MLTRHFTWNAAETTGAASRRAWPVFAVLLALMVVDYVDRQIVVSLLTRARGRAVAHGHARRRLRIAVRDVPGSPPSFSPSPRAPIALIYRASNAASRDSPDSASKRREPTKTGYHVWLAIAWLA